MTTSRDIEESVSYTDEAPVLEEEPTPVEVVEHKPTVMSKLMGSA